MAEIGSAFLSIMPSAKGFGGALDKQVSGPLASSGRKMSGVLSKTLKAGAIATGAAVAGTIGTALFKGFSRLQGIEQAEAKLAGLGHTAKSVDKIMSNALTSVKGTAFGLDEAATTAATAVAAGIKPGKELADYLTLVGDAATISGVSMAEMGRVMNKARTLGGAYNDTLQTLAERGLPVYSLLSKELGVSAAEVKKLASEGKISAGVLEDALRKNVAGAAQKSGKTVSGAFANMQAALGRLGASVLGGVFDKIPAALGVVTSRLDAMGPSAERIGRVVGKYLASAFDVAGRTLAQLGEVFGKVRDSLARFQPVVERIGQFMRENPKVVKAFAITLGVLAAAIGIVTLATAAFSLALQTTGIPLLIIGIAALVAGLVYAYQHSERFRAIVQAVGAGLREFAGWVQAEVIPVISALAARVATNLQPVFAALSSFFSGTVLPVVQRLIVKFREYQPAIQRVIGVVLRFTASMIDLSTKILGKVLPPLIRFAGFLMRTIPPAIGMAVKAIGGIIRASMAFAQALVTGGQKMTAFARVVHQKVNEVVKFFATLPGRVLGALIGLGTRLYEAGRELISGLIDGVKSKLADVGNAMKSVGSKIKGYLPGSPVKEGPLRSWNNGGAGKRLMKLLAKGIDSEAGTVAKSMERVTASIKKAMEKGDLSKSVGRQMQKVIKQVTKQAAKVRTLMADRLDLANQVSSNLRGEFNLSDIFAPNEFGFAPSAGQGVKIAQGVAARMKAFAGKLARLGKAGLPAALIQEIAGYGSAQGSTIADAFLNASPSDTRSFTSAYSDFNKYAGIAGTAVAGATFDSRITKAQADLDKKSMREAVRDGLRGARINVDVGINKRTQAEVYIGGKKEFERRR